MKHRRAARRKKEVAELNITTFMNLMVILVPFLLITAVFSRLAIVELDLPLAESNSSAEQPEFSLEVIVRQDSIEVGDRNRGSLELLPKIEGEYDYSGLTDYLKRVKVTFPDKLDVALLLEPDVEYDVLVQVIDATRSYPEVMAGDVVKAVLFPEVSIGDAPMLTQDR
jgi:biopolymer transport protein ExbD